MIKQVYFGTIIVIVFLVSCLSPAKDKNVVNEENKPQALQKNLLSDVEYSVRGSDFGYSVVDRLFKEHLETNEALKETVKNLRTIQDSLRFHKRPIEDFIRTNRSFYSDLEYVIATIKDSVLVAAFSNRGITSEQKFYEKIKHYYKVDSTLSIPNAEVNDLLAALKVSITLKMMEDYQTGTAINLKSLEKRVAELEKIKAELQAELASTTR